MKTPLLSAIALLAALALVLFLMRRAKAAAAWPYYVKRPLSQPEQVLYHRLTRALPEHIVLAQVQASRVLGVKKGFPFHPWNNRINRLSYDFVICSKDAGVIAAIELDDKTHDAPTRRQTDTKKNKASADAGLPLIRWNVRSLPSEEAIRSALAQLPTQKNPTRTPTFQWRQ